MHFRLNVIQGKGAPQALDIDALDASDARLQAERLGYTVLSLTASAWRLDTSLFSRTPRQRIDVPVFVEQLRDLLVAGLSIIEALDALRRGAKGATLHAIEALERQLREGRTLSESLAVHRTFPPLLIALVSASEHTSDLPDTLTRFLDHEQRVTEVRHKLVSTGIYPMLLMGVGTLVLLFLLFYVMPRFARVFESMNGNLPWTARAMVQWSHLLHANASAWWAGAAAVVLSLVTAVTSPHVRTKIFGRILAWAPLRERLRTYFLSRWYRATGMLVQGGIPLAQALHLANDLLPASLQPGGRAVQLGIEQGLAPSAAHSRAGMATPVAEQLMQAGERTGDLGMVLTRIANFHEVEVSRALERTMRALEPVVMVAIGLGVGLVVILMYMPIFELAASIQ